MARKDIKEALALDLMSIQPGEFFTKSISAVTSQYIEFEKVDKYKCPAIVFSDGGAKITKNSENVQEVEWTIYLFAYIKEDNAEAALDLLLEDIMTLFMDMTGLKIFEVGIREVEVGAVMPDPIIISKFEAIGYIPITLRYIR